MNVLVQVDGVLTRDDVNQGGALLTLGLGNGLGGGFHGAHSIFSLDVRMGWMDKEGISIQ